MRDEVTSGPSGRRSQLRQKGTNKKSCRLSCQNQATLEKKHPAQRDAADPPSLLSPREKAQGSDTGTVDDTVTGPGCEQVFTTIVQLEAAKMAKKTMQGQVTTAFAEKDPDAVLLPATVSDQDASAAGLFFKEDEELRPGSGGSRVFAV